MEDKIVLLDTSILIDFFRKTHKQRTLFRKLSVAYSDFRISVITHFEILRGSNPKQEEFWKQILKDIPIVSYFPMLNYSALHIREELKKKRKSISFEDLIIAATALHFDFTLATLNEDHFNFIDNIKLITPASFE